MKLDVPINIYLKLEQMIDYLDTLMAEALQCEHLPRVEERMCKA